MKLSWRRSRDITADPARGLTGAARAAALGVPDEPDPADDASIASIASTASTASLHGGHGPAAVGDAPSPASAPTPALSGPVMLTLTTRARVEEAEREAALAAAQPVRRRLERGAFGGSAPTGGGCSSGSCG